MIKTLIQSARIANRWVRAALPREKPSALIIGAQKSGTTALYKYLASHPRILMPANKELDFFNCDSRYQLGVNFYHRQFPVRRFRNQNCLTLDVTPGYLGSAHFSAERIYNYNSDIKLLAILRDPVQRAFSAWNMYRRKYQENTDWYFRWMSRCDLKKVEENQFVRRSHDFGKDFCSDIKEEIEVANKKQLIEMPVLSNGRYDLQLAKFVEYFDWEKILILFTEEMHADTANVLRKVEKFLQIEPFDWHSVELPKVFVGSYENPIPKNATVLLQDYYRESRSRLKRMLDSNIPWNKYTTPTS